MISPAESTKGKDKRKKRFKLRHLHIGNPSELFKQVLGQETDDGVLGGDYLGRRIEHRLRNLSLLVVHTRREFGVDEDGPGRGREGLSLEEVLRVEVMLKLVEERSRL